MPVKDIAHDKTALSCAAMIGGAGRGQETVRFQDIIVGIRSGHIGAAATVFLRPAGGSQ
jgi:hypothetical protein